MSCPNCGKEHSGLNHYCQECSIRFRKWGMWDYVDGEGFRDTKTGEGCLHTSFISRLVFIPEE